MNLLLLKVFFAFLYGIVIGSFLNVLIHRLPQGKSIIKPGSHCPNCGAPIAFYDNIPLISYLILRGKCRNCKSSISYQYPLVEGITGTLFVIFYLKSGLSLVFITETVFSALIIVLIFTDLNHQLLPDVITIPGTIGGLLFSLNGGLTTIGSSLIGAGLGAGIVLAIRELYFRLRGEEGMGLGDVKLMAMIGAFLGWERALLTLVIGSFLGSVVGIIIIAKEKGDLRFPLPFGSFLGIASIFSLFYGEELISFYRSFF
ncbi:MAG: prepilin peptidase [Acidobacteria bacterium]|nr:prepilin peptidase [Acidobacteriota bacterium]